MCGLCDQSKAVLVKMAMYAGKGHVMACGGCISDLMGKSPIVE